MILLMLCGDVHPNPGPMPQHETPESIAHDERELNKISATNNYPRPTMGEDAVSTCDNLRVLNWNCRGLDNKLEKLPEILLHHDIHIAILTETRRSINKYKTSRPHSMRGYTFHFSSYLDSSHSASAITPRAREWGVCIAIIIGLAYQAIDVNFEIFAARVIHGSLIFPTHSN
jgi:hypothetical protein